MKKLLLLLLVVPFAWACSSDDDDYTPIQYLDNKLIEGSWYHIQYADSTVYIFENNKAIRRGVDKYYPKDSKDRNLGNYKLDKEYIYFDGKSGSKTAYQLKGDTLYLNEGGGIYTDYKKVK